MSEWGEESVVIHVVSNILTLEGDRERTWKREKV